jgi:hypothetical protein
MHPRFSEIANTWYVRLWKILTEGADLAALGERLASIAFIIFNYDRCVEHFFIHALQTKYGLDVIQAIQMFSLIEIRHPYGVVGALPWQSGAQNVPFGGSPESDKLLCLANRIGSVAYREGYVDKIARISLDALRQVVAQSETLVFLGMAYHPGNLALVSPSPAQTTVRRCFGTAMGLTESGQVDLRARLRKFAGIGASRVDSVGLYDATCGEMVQTLGRALVS